MDCPNENEHKHEHENENEGRYEMKWEEMSWVEATSQVTVNMKVLGKIRKEKRRKEKDGCALHYDLRMIWWALNLVRLFQALYLVLSNYS